MLGALYYHYSRFGWRGLGTVGRQRIFGGTHYFDVTHADARHPLRLRVGTSDVPTYQQVFLEHEYEFVALRQPAVIVDAGANVGFASILFATRYPDARIIAIEPESANFELLVENTRPYANIETIQAALWKESGEIDLLDAGFGNWGFMTGDADRDPQPGVAAVSRIRALTIDELMRDYNIRSIDILKIDIEGAEREVFQTAAGWIEYVQAMIVELHERMKPGCIDSFEPMSRSFALRWTRGENIYLSREGVISAS